VFRSKTCSGLFGLSHTLAVNNIIAQLNERFTCMIADPQFNICCCHSESFKYSLNQSNKYCCLIFLLYDIILLQWHPYWLPVSFIVSDH
jgi:hypothetical protein